MRWTSAAGRLGLMAVGLWLAATGWEPTAAWVAARLGPVEVARTGELTEALQGTLVVARRERLLAAPGPGRVEPVAGEGEAVAAGSVVAVVRPLRGGPPWTLRAPMPGVVSYYADGLESWQGPELAFAAERPPDPRQPLTPLLDGRPVAAGQPVVRMVDRSALYAVFWPAGGDGETAGRQGPGAGAGGGGIGSAKAGSQPADGRGSLGPSGPRALRPGMAVELALPGEPVGLRASVLEVRGRGSSRRVLLSVDRQLADWLYRRRLRDARLVVRRFRGVLVPASSVAWVAGRAGVWVRARGGASWVPVEVLAQGGRQAVVRGVPAGAQVYRWPRWLTRY